MYQMTEDIIFLGPFCAFPFLLQITAEVLRIPLEKLICLAPEMMRT